MVKKPSQGDKTVPTLHAIARVPDCLEREMLALVTEIEIDFVKDNFREDVDQKSMRKLDRQFTRWKTLFKDFDPEADPSQHDKIASFVFRAASSLIMLGAKRDLVRKWVLNIKTAFVKCIFGALPIGNISSTCFS